jgi:hypothetical protein
MINILSIFIFIFSLFIMPKKMVNGHYCLRKLTVAPFGQLPPPEALQAQRPVPEPSKVPPKTERPATISNTIHSPTRPKLAQFEGAIIVPYNCTLILLLAQGPVKVTGPTKNFPCGIPC